MRLLFVDDEQRVLEGIRREFLAIDRTWEAEFAQTGPEALDRLSKAHFDAIISDMRMPDMDGVQLLKAVADSHPDVLRVVLSGHCEHEVVLRSITLAHRYLTKPSTAQDLERTIDSAFRLRSAIQGPEILSLVTGLGQLPTLPRIFLAIDRELASLSPSIHRIADLISEDIGLTAKLLHLVNSAFFALVRTINSVAEAVTYLGLDTIRGLVVALELSRHDADLNGSGVSHTECLHHSTSTARLARHICRTMNYDSLVAGHAFIAAMLHDIGTLILAGHCPMMYRQCVDGCASRGCPVWQLEQEVFGTTHGFVGAYLLSLWGLSDSIVSAVAYHHHPDTTAVHEGIPLIVTYTADQLIHGVPVETLGEDPLLESAGLTPHLLGWAEVAHAYANAEMAASP